MKFITVIILLLASLCAFCAEPVCEVAYNKDISRRSQQGMAVWGDMVLAFEHGGHCVVYDRSDGALRKMGEFDVESSSPQLMLKNQCFKY